jgi:hypothetical protein
MPDTELERRVLDGADISALRELVMRYQELRKKVESSTEAGRP